MQKKQLFIFSHLIQNQKKVLIFPSISFRLKHVQQLYSLCLACITHNSIKWGPAHLDAKDFLSVLVAWPWANYLIFMYLWFLIYTMGRVISPVWDKNEVKSGWQMLTYKTQTSALDRKPWSCSLWL
jgi:hypothetical protein